MRTARAALLLLLLSALTPLLLHGCARKANSSFPAGPLPPAKETPPLTAFPLDKGRLMLHAPKGWEFNREELSNADAALFPEGSEKPLPVILVQAKKVGAGQPMAEAVARFSKYVARGIDDPSIVRDEKRTIPLEHAEAYHIGYTGTVDGTPVSGSQVLIRRFEYLYVVTAIADARQKSMLDKALDYFLDHIK